MPTSDRNGNGSAVQKVERARHHLESFQTEIDEFLEAHLKPYEVIVDVETNEAGNEVEIHRLRVLRRPPVALSVIAGDAIQNARAALDHLVFQASTAHTPTMSKDQQREVGFPIARLVRDFDPRQISAVAPEVVTFIQGLQPYHAKDPDRHPLLRLRDLSNIDKHRTLHLMFAEVAAVALFPGRQMKGPVRLSAPGVGSGQRLLEDGAVITTAVRETPGKMQVNPSATLHIRFAEPRNTWHARGAAGLIREIVDFVDSQVVTPCLALMGDGHSEPPPISPVEG
jgi:hypothetical protein